MKIEGARVLVTGGNRGIGLALAKAFSKEGAHVWIGVRNVAGPDVATALEEINQAARSGAQQSAPANAIELDLASREKIEKSLPAILNLNIDILVNNAGQLTGGLLEEQPLDDIYSMFQVNLLGLTHLTHAVLPGMLERKRGKVVNNASVSGIMNFPLASTYSAAKTGVVALTMCLAAELRGSGVSTLVMLTPGVQTRMFDELKTKYGSKLDLSTLLEGAVAPEVWARSVVEAVLDDQEVVSPSGMTGIGLKIARHAPRIFRSLVLTKFRRRGLSKS